MSRKYSDATLRTWKKAELIEHIRCLEANVAGLEDRIDTQFLALCELTKNLSSNEFDAIMRSVKNRKANRRADDEID